MSYTSKQLKECAQFLNDFSRIKDPVVRLEVLNSISQNNDLQQSTALRLAILFTNITTYTENPASNAFHSVPELSVNDFNAIKDALLPDLKAALTNFSYLKNTEVRSASLFDSFEQENTTSESLTQIKCY